MGGSGGGGSPYYNVQPEALQKRIKEASDDISRDFLPRLQEFLDEKLSSYNRRDTDLIEERLSAVAARLGDLLEAEWDFRFGGSVAKHTYVDGLSDIDSLLILGGEFDGTRSPKSVLDAVSKQLSGLPTSTSVSAGRIAITIEYRDGMQLQLIPAVKDKATLRVPSSIRDGWSNIDPVKFTSALTRRNSECDGKLIPTIKLAKATMATWPESVRLSGYHVESLAIDAFRGYSGPKNTATMLPKFFESSSTSVLRPIRDSTGQSIHVDSYLGKANSEIRQKASHWCLQVSKRMKNASIQGSFNQWRELFDE